MKITTRLKLLLILTASTLTLFTSCKTDNSQKQSSTVDKTVKIPAFMADSAYAYVAKQVAFGPRVPGSPEHAACKDWMVEKFKGFGADVIVQDFIANIYTGDQWQSYNIIAQFNPQIKKRIILAAHWDSRMIAEQDKNKDKRAEPILGADDGGSGVGVLIEIARLLHANPIEDLGVDIILFDAEDQGKRGPNEPPNNWCLGAQYWAKNIHTSNYRPSYGILLDMVGARNPHFGKDLISKQYAGVIQDKVWSLAHGMGYSDMFDMNTTGELTDDHYFVNVIAGIPMIDIINHDPRGETGFGAHWHTHDDNLDVIDKRTLKVVGQIITAVVYKESIGKL
jgi:glutaminyl-peptide cyclotransferase